MHGPFADSTRRAAAPLFFPSSSGPLDRYQPISFHFQKNPRGEGETLIRAFLTRISDKSFAIVSIRLSILERLSSINENNIPFLRSRILAI